jgi:PAS domain S-box-containing protein/putative nucleotidyltransferase with HDIG domain
MRAKINKNDPLNIIRTNSAQPEIQAERRFRLLAENAADVIWTVDMNLQPTYMSPSVSKLLGYDVKEALKKKMEEVFTPLSFKSALQVLMEELAFEKEGQKDLNRSRTLEFEMVHRNGSIVPVEIKYAFVRNEEGQPLEILAIARDISERKHSEQEIKSGIEKLQKSYHKLQKAMEGAIEAIALIVEMRDPYTAGHQRRVAKLAAAIAEEMGLPDEQTAAIRIAGILHDIGKVAVPAEILSKPSGLTEPETDLIRNHPKIGREILKTMDLPWQICPIVFQHHERLDGSGYPNKLVGEDILLESRILAVADVVEAMSSHRPYRPALGVDAALDEISRNKDILYDARVVDTCIRLFKEKGFSFE